LEQLVILLRYMNCWVYVASSDVWWDVNVLPHVVSFVTLRIVASCFIGRTWINIVEDKFRKIIEHKKGGVSGCDITRKFAYRPHLVLLV
jgi:hypothetical protein